VLWHSKLWCLASSGNIASSLYNNLKGMKPVALEAVVLWDQTIFGNSSTHLPLRRWYNVLEIAEKTTLFALSTAPFDSGWWTDAKAIVVSKLLQKFLKLSESNCFPLSTVRILGTLNLQIMFCQMNFLIDSKVMVASGFASICLVKYLIATIANLFPLWRWWWAYKVHTPSL
jgi:hypothetical protein